MIKTQDIKENGIVAKLSLPDTSEPCPAIIVLHGSCGGFYERVAQERYSVYETSYYLVWCPKYRRDIFRAAEIRKRAKELISAICNEYDFEVEELEVSTDHVHIMLSIPPSRAIGYAIRVIKSITARELFREFPELKRRLWSRELWEDGYFARTVGSRMTSEVIKKYIKHHRELEQ